MPTGDGYEGYKIHREIEAERKRREADAEAAHAEPAGNDASAASEDEPYDEMSAVLSQAPVFDEGEPGLDDESWRQWLRRSQGSAEYRGSEHGEPEPAADGDEGTS